jgi:hypothetical protein
LCGFHGSLLALPAANNFASGRRAGKRKQGSSLPIPALSRAKSRDKYLRHAGKHGCSIAEIEAVVRREIRSARRLGDEKWTIVGRGQGDRFVRVIFVEDKDDDGTIYVIHAMPIRRR